MFKEILENLYPFITQKEALFTIIYSVLFWCVVGLTSTAILFILPVVIISYYCFSIGGEKNSTFGMKICKIELVNRKNRKLTIKELLIYNFLFFTVTPIALVLLISFIIPLINDERRCIHDYIFKTKFNSLSKV